MARWYYNILYHPRIEIAVCLFTAGLLPYTNPRYGFFFVCFAATSRAEPRQVKDTLLCSDVVTICKAHKPIVRAPDTPSRTWWRG